MPIIEVSMFEGRTLDQKRELVAKMTDVVVETLNVKPQAVRVLIREMKKENWAIAGQLKCDEQQ